MYLDTGGGPLISFSGGRSALLDEAVGTDRALSALRLIGDRPPGDELRLLRRACD